MLLFFSVTRQTKLCLLIQDSWVDFSSIGVQYMCDVITRPCLWYLLVANTPAQVRNIMIYLFYVSKHLHYALSNAATPVLHQS